MPRGIARSIAVLAATAPFALLLGAAPASAYSVPGYKEAYFKTTIEGTFVSTGHDSSECTVEDPETLERTRYPTTTTVEDRVDFTTRRAGVAQVSTLRHLALDAGMTRNARVHARWTRSRTTVAGGPCAPDPQAERCGARDRDFGAGIFGRQKRDAFAYALRIRSGPIFPDDPYGSDCALVSFQLSWGKLQVAGTPASRARMFNRHVRKIVLHGVERHSDPRNPQSGNAYSTRELRYTITLVRQR